MKTTSCPRGALSTVSSFKPHAKQCQDSCYSASTSVSTRIAAPDSKTVLSGRADKDVLTVCSARICPKRKEK